MRPLSLLTFFLFGLLLACTENVPSSKPEAKALDDYAFDKITDRVYVIHGPNELPNPANRGFMNNPGVVLTDKGVVIIDPGSTTAVGKMLLSKIKGLSNEPVIAVFNTHHHGDHWLANSAIKAAHPKAIIYAHPKMKQRAANTGEDWIKLMQRMTENKAGDIQARIPDISVDGEESLKLGDITFRFYHSGTAHTDNDIMIELVEPGVIFLGDNVLHQRIGRMDDGNFTGNIKAIDIALASEAKFFIPGHGPSGGPEVAKAYRDYLATLYQTVAEEYEKDKIDFEMKPDVVKQLSAYHAWTGFDDEVGRHVARAYLQVEAEAF